jgi:hypothetical protein
MCRFGCFGEKFAEERFPDDRVENGVRVFVIYIDDAGRPAED